MSGTARLYTPELLGLAVELADHPLGERAWQTRGEARSPACGSVLTLGIDTDADGAIAAFGLRCSTCAVGQAAAALFARAAFGKDRAAIDAARGGIAAWLGGEAKMPEWPGLAPLVPARDYPARHGAILLAWNAASQALSLAPQAG